MNIQGRMNVPVEDFRGPKVTHARVMVNMDPRNINQSFTVRSNNSVLLHIFLAEQKKAHIQI